MVQDAVWISVVEQPSGTGPCQLCATDPATLAATVVVRHSRGGTVQFMACDRCTRAMQRVAAAIGAESHVAQVTTAGTNTPPPATEPARVLSAEVVLEYAEHVIDAAGTRYVVRACGGPRSDGIWTGWLELLPVGQQGVRRTGQETTQSNRDDLVYWASGLEPVYLQGAFARSR